MKTKDVKVYITEDGKEFTDEKKANHHELMLRSDEAIKEVEKFISVSTTGKEVILGDDGQMDDDQMADFYEAIPSYHKPFDEIETPHDLAELAVNMVIDMDGLMLKAMGLAIKLLTKE